MFCNPQKTKIDYADYQIQTGVAQSCFVSFQQIMHHFEVLNVNFLKFVYCDSFCKHKSHIIFCLVQKNNKVTGLFGHEGKEMGKTWKTFYHFLSLSFTLIIIGIGMSC